MLTVFNNLRDLTLLSIFLRIFFSVLCSGCIGLEREYKRRSAGFRTHILICLGATITTMTGQYLSIYMHLFTDMTRLGAQVIAGIGFIGAGAIITTQNKQVRGLTTSAGLWTSAIIGLCFGAGFFEGGIIAALLTIFAEVTLSRLEYWMRDHAPIITFYLEYKRKSTIDALMKLLHDKNIHVESMEISRTYENGDDGKKIMCAIVTAQMTRENPVGTVINEIKAINGMLNVEEL